MLKAVIFDMDGVIVDSEPLHIKAERETLSPYGVSLTDRELQFYMGRTSRILLSDSIKKYHIPVDNETVYASHLKRLVRLYREESEMMPGALELIRQMYEEGLRLAVGSSSDKILIRTMVERFKLDAYFQALVSAEEVTHAKPSPDIFLKAANWLGVKPEACVVIEDSRAGVQAAKLAGMKCVGFRSPHSQNQDLNDADWVVDRLSDISISELNSLFN